LEKLIHTVCEAYGVAPDQLIHKGRANALSTANAVICYWGTTKLGVSSTELAIRLDMSQPAVSQAAKRGRRYNLDHDVEQELN